MCVVCSKVVKNRHQFIETYQRYYHIPGVSFALIKEGKLVYHKTYGVRNRITSEKVEDQTLFAAASITKPVYAFAVERLADRGVIDLDKPLYEYLPYKDIEQDERYKLITERHVLTHRTGFPNWCWMNPDNKLNIKFKPGTSFGYSGECFEYIKLVVEKINGKKDRAGITERSD
ncbi:serine hydrolase domain-containing protein [Niastella sp. OAS944]|uniref:serine hydrolase domain-containing protein n=1 Tax=Niastella sp. OAS944 TaxID=2664089 RepID=UPI003498E9C9|nr:CubicO group peptidase (beta-lactamase class C family) [Chitinophagaceae bacterium OAS944]